MDENVGPGMYRTEVKQVVDSIRNLLEPQEVQTEDSNETLPEDYYAKTVRRRVNKTDDPVELLQRRLLDILLSLQRSGWKKLLYQCNRGGSREDVW